MGNTSFKTQLYKYNRCVVGSVSNYILSKSYLFNPIESPQKSWNSHNESPWNQREKLSPALTVEHHAQQSCKGWLSCLIPKKRQGIARGPGPKLFGFEQVEWCWKWKMMKYQVGLPLLLSERCGKSWTASVRFWNDEKLWYIYTHGFWDNRMFQRELYFNAGPGQRELVSFPWNQNIHRSTKRTCTKPGLPSGHYIFWVQKSSQVFGHPKSSRLPFS